MKRTTRIALSILTSLTVHGGGFISSALAETVTVTRGPNGAAHAVKVDQVPLDAQIQRNSPATSVPRVVTQGPNGAAHIARTESVSKTTAQSSGTLKVISRGPNGAAHIAN